MILSETEWFNGFKATVLAITSLGIGFFAGSRLSTTRSSKGRRGLNVGSEDINEDTALNNTDECKLVLVVRTDLKMSTGKIAAQCSHATLACYQTLENTNARLLRQWERAGQTKVALRCSNEEELLDLQSHAQRLNLCARSIRDAGRTQIAAGSRTVLGIIGPVRLVNQITSKLRLL